MQIKKVVTMAATALFILVVLGGSVLAQEKASAPANPPAAKAMKLTVVGKIIKDESMGGYYIQGKKPAEIFRIVNQNPKVLGKFAKAGKDVSIEARSAMGDNLVIEKIEGKKYTEGKKK